MDNDIERHFRVLVLIEVFSLITTFHVHRHFPDIILVFIIPLINPIMIGLKGTLKILPDVCILTSLIYLLHYGLSKFTI